MTERFADLGGRPSTTTPPPGPLRGCGQPVCNHNPDHQCPWLNETDQRGKAIPCPCTHQPKEAKR